MTRQCWDTIRIAIRYPSIPSPISSKIAMHYPLTKKATDKPDAEACVAGHRALVLSGLHKSLPCKEGPGNHRQRLRRCGRVGPDYRNGIGRCGQGQLSAHDGSGQGRESGAAHSVRSAGGRLQGSLLLGPVHSEEDASVLWFCSTAGPAKLCRYHLKRRYFSKGVAHILLHQSPCRAQSILRAPIAMHLYLTRLNSLLTLRS